MTLRKFNDDELYEEYDIVNLTFYCKIALNKLAKMDTNTKFVLKNGTAFKHQN